MKKVRKLASLALALIMAFTFIPVLSITAVAAEGDYLWADFACEEKNGNFEMTHLVVHLEGTVTSEPTVDITSWTMDGAAWDIATAPSLVKPGQLSTADGVTTYTLQLSVPLVMTSNYVLNFTCGGAAKAAEATVHDLAALGDGAISLDNRPGTHVVKGAYSAAPDNAGSLIGSTTNGFKGTLVLWNVDINLTNRWATQYGVGAQAVSLWGMAGTAPEIILQGQNKITATNGSADDSLTGAFFMQNAKVTGSGSLDIAIGAGKAMHTQGTSILNANISAVSGKGAGIVNYDDLKITGGTIIAKGGEANYAGSNLYGVNGRYPDQFFAGIVAGRSLDISGGTVYAEGGFGIMTRGGNITIGAPTTAKANPVLGETGNYAGAGIGMMPSGGTLTINSTLVATGGESGINSRGGAGIFLSGSTMVVGPAGDVTATGGK
ncbi:MAG: hypothetical protein GXY32_10015, partial [Ruminococcaceae bacterium]|nr:hypothetical protein [Oscillospiraceae bacterium]